MYVYIYIYTLYCPSWKAVDGYIQFGAQEHTTNQTRGSR